jgi:adenylate cyclase
MDWDAEGLVEGLEDDAARAARRALLDELHADGASPEDLRAAVKEDRLVLLAVERRLTSEPRYSLREMCDQTGMELELMMATRRALGLPVPDPDERLFGEDDLEATRLGLQHREAGFADEDALEVTRVLGRGMASYAEATRALVAQTFAEPGISELELSHRYQAVAERLMPLAGAWLEHVFAQHLRQVLRSDAVTQEQRRTGRLGGAQEATVAFADLVGFTRLGETVPLEELGSVAGELSRLAAEAVDPPVRLVKQIGDAVMLISPEPAPMVATALTLIERAAEDEHLPALRAGVACGAAVNRWGDWFGTPVNLASRLTTRARPGSVLVTEAVRQHAADGFDYSDAGPKRLKGFSAPVHAYRARRAA